MKRKTIKLKVRPTTSLLHLIPKLEMPEGYEIESAKATGTDAEIRLVRVADQLGSGEK